MKLRKISVRNADTGEFEQILAFKGGDGKTPVKGVDYNTTTDRQEIIDAVIGNIPSIDIDGAIGAHNDNPSSHADIRTLIVQYLASSKTYTNEQIALLIGTAPELLNTLEEIAEAIVNNESVVDALNDSIANKLGKEEAKRLYVALQGYVAYSQSDKDKLEGIDMASKQNKTDDALDTTSKDIVGAINEIKANPTGLEEAPLDSKEYVRCDGAWTAIEVPDVSGSKWFTGGLGTASSVNVNIPGSRIGDFCISTNYSNSAYVYECTATNVWTRRIDIKGPAGGYGQTGSPGAAATITVGTVTTGVAGSQAAVSNSGSSSAARFNFTIPRGDKGEQGIQGTGGDKGDKGDTGDKGEQGIQGAVDNAMLATLAKADFSNITSKLLSSDGYYKLPDGMMIQWGKKTSSSSQGTIYFSINFLAVFSVCTTVSNVSLDYGYGAYVNTTYTSRFDYRIAFTGGGGGSSAAEGFYWIAIGRWK